MHVILNRECSCMYIIFQGSVPWTLSLSMTQWEKPMHLQNRFSLFVSLLVCPPLFGPFARSISLQRLINHLPDTSCEKMPCTSTASESAPSESWKSLFYSRWRYLNAAFNCDDLLRIVFPSEANITYALSKIVCVLNVLKLYS